MHKEKIIQYTSKELLLSLPISKLLKNCEHVSIQIKLESEEKFLQKSWPKMLPSIWKGIFSWLVRALAHQVFLKWKEEFLGKKVKTECNLLTFRSFMKKDCSTHF